MFEKIDYVYAVYKEKSFTRAAEKLFISQPSLSAAVKTVEKEVGAPLFDRTGANITLTEVGKEYILAAEKIISVREDFCRKLSDIFALETGKLTVGGTNYLSSYVLPKIVNKFTALHPKIEVTLAEAKSVSLSEMLQREEIDVVIDSFDETVNEYAGTPLASERILLCVPAESAVNAGLEAFRIFPDDIYEGKIRLDEVPTVPMNRFQDESFVLLKSGNDMYNRATRIFERANIAPKVAFSVDQMNIAYALADSGMGLCFMTDTFFKYGKTRGNVVLYNVGKEAGSRTLYIAYKKNKYLSRALTEFINVAKQVICL